MRRFSAAARSVDDLLLALFVGRGVRLLVTRLADFFFLFFSLNSVFTLFVSSPFSGLGL